MVFARSYFAGLVLFNALCFDAKEQGSNVSPGSGQEKGYGPKVLTNLDDCSVLNLPTGYYVAITGFLSGCYVRAEKAVVEYCKSVLSRVISRIRNTLRIPNNDHSDKFVHQQFEQVLRGSSNVDDHKFQSWILGYMKTQKFRYHDISKWWDGNDKIALYVFSKCAALHH